MIAGLAFFALAWTGAQDRVDTEIDAVVARDLATIRIATKTLYTPSVDVDSVTVVLAADRYAEIPRDLRAAHERSVFPNGHSFGGFDDVAIHIDGSLCVDRADSRLEDGATVVACRLRVAKDRTVAIETRSVLRVPERYGQFGRHRRQLTLAGGWTPYVARVGAEPPMGRHRLRVEIPAGFGAVVGRRYFAPVPDEGSSARTIVSEESSTVQLPLVVLPPSTSAMSVARGDVLAISRRATTARRGGDGSRQLSELVRALEDGMMFLGEDEISVPISTRPLLVVEAPLRHELAVATEGVVLVSDRAFRLLPFERVLRFHRFPILREVFGMVALRLCAERSTHPRAVVADAVASWLTERYIASRFGRAEDAFDVLDFWSFIPAVDSMLYAPEIPFVEAYFRMIREDDPLRPSVVDYPSVRPRGKLVYEKLVDRVGRRRADRAMRTLLVSGGSLEDALRPLLFSETESFLATWLGPHPNVRYRLAEHAASAVARDRCDAASARCLRATATIKREGDVIAEPVQVRFVDDEGRVRIVSSTATTAASRVVTATLGADLASVELDPFSRLAETPSDDDPSPRFDNRAPHAWRFLLNNFNLLWSPSAATVDTALDVGISRVRDVRFRHAMRLDYAPDAVGFGVRTSWGFGARATADRLRHSIGASVSADYLLPGFAARDDDAFALSSSIHWGYDDRTTVWAPEAGRAIAIALTGSHVFANLSGESTTNDALSFTVRALESWRVGAAHQVSLRVSGGTFVVGTPREQLLYALGGRRNVRGYRIDDAVGRTRGIASVEWVHAIIPELDDSAMFLAWISGLDGALFGDIAVIGDDLRDLGDKPMLADFGYGLRVYVDYFGVRPGVMSIDLAFPLVDLDGRARVGSPAVYIDFAQSFLVY